MLKPTLKNILIYLFVKYLIFFIILAFLGGRFKSIVIANSENKQQIFSNSVYYFLQIAIFSFLLMLIFSIPMYGIFKIKNWIYFVPMIILFLVTGYLFYTYLASQTDRMNGIYNGAISIILLIFFLQTDKISF